MTSRTIVLTGASDGIGAAAARQLHREGHRVLLVGRSPEKTRAVGTELGVEWFAADFAVLDEVRALAADLAAATDRIDVLANNAGGVFGARRVTRDGNELTLQVNHLAPFLLTRLLLDRLRAGAGIVVNTSSSAAQHLGRLDLDDLQHERSYSPNRAYGDAKLANILFTRGLTARHHDDGIASVAFDPGNVATNFAASTTSWFRLVYRTPLRHLFLIPPAQGGANLAYFVTGTPGEDWLEEQFYTQTTPATPAQTNPRMFDVGLVDGLWERSEELVRER